MENQMLKCRNCNAPLKYVSGATHVKCEYCGTEYILKQNKTDNNSPIKEINYLNRGTLFISYIPEGWNYRVFDDDNNFSRLAAICKGLKLESPQGSSILFYPFAYYKNFNKNGVFNSGIKLAKNYSFDPASLTRYRYYDNMEEYVKERFNEIIGEAEITEVKRLTDLDEFLKSQAFKFNNEASQKLNTKTEVTWGKYLINFTYNERKLSALFATIISYKEKQEESREKEPEKKEEKKKGTTLNDFIKFGMSGGLIGAKMRKEEPSINLPEFKIPNINLNAKGSYNGILGHNWGKNFDVMLTASSDEIEMHNTIFNDFCINIKYGDLYYALQDEEMKEVERAIIQGMQQRTQNSINASRRLSQTLSETSDIINRGYEQRSRTMDDISAKRSEAIRGVNSYTDKYGDNIEASVDYEHVYQNGSTFVGSKEGNLELGPDWVELKKKN